MKWLIAYDISCPSRLRRVYRALSTYAIPLQNSVFLLIGKEADFAACINAVLLLIHRTQDDLRVYLLPQRTECHTLGAKAIPEGIIVGAQVLECEYSKPDNDLL